MATTAGGAAAAAASVLGGLLWYARKEIQGYWFDCSCPAPDRDLSGRVALVTGANQGLGKAAALDLAAMGATVVLACRSEARAMVAVQDIKSATGNPKISFLNLDMSSKASIQAAAAEFQKHHQRLDFLVLNAGVGDGRSDLMWQTNYLGAFQLTELLLPLAERAAAAAPESSGAGAGGAPERAALVGGDLGARIVAVSSGAHKRATIDFGSPFEPSESGMMGPYGQSKLAQIMHMKELSRRLADRGLEGKVIPVSCTPGFARTSLIPLKGPLSWILWPLVLLMSRSTWRGAQVIKLCCIGQVAPGGYYSNCYEKPAQGREGISNDPQAQKRLWDLSQRLLSEGRFP